MLVVKKRKHRHSNFILPDKIKFHVSCHAIYYRVIFNSSYIKFCPPYNWKQVRKHPQTEFGDFSIVTSRSPEKPYTTMLLKLQINPVQQQYNNNCPCFIIIHIMTQTTVTTSPLVHCLFLSDSQSASRLYFYLSLSFTLICSCLLSVAAINLFRWNCKSVISWFTLTVEEMVNIAQIGFSQSPLIPPISV